VARQGVWLLLYDWIRRGEALLPIGVCDCSRGLSHAGNVDAEGLKSLGMAGGY